MHDDTYNIMYVLYHHTLYIYHIHELLCYIYIYISYIRIIYVYVCVCCGVGCCLLYLCFIFVFVFSIRSTNFRVPPVLIMMKTDLPPHVNT